MNDEQLVRILTYLYNNIKSEAYAIDGDIPLIYYTYFTHKDNTNIISRENAKILMAKIYRKLMKQQLNLKVEPYLTNKEK